MSLYSKLLSEVVTAVVRGDDVDKYNRIKSGTLVTTVTPLGYAIEKNSIDVFKYLIRRRADVNKVVRDGGETPLWYAISNKRYNFVDFLLKSGAKKTFRNRFSLLTYSIWHCNLNLFNCLIKNGVDVNEVDGHGLTPLLAAVKKVEIEVIKTLLDYGAEFSIRTALIEAIPIEQLQIVNLLTERGVDVNFQSVTGFTPLTKATNIGNLEITELLIKKGANVNLLDFQGNSPLINSIRLGQLDLVQLLVENGANVQQADGGGNLPITEALNTKLFSLIKFITENGAKLDNVRDKDGYSPLTQSVQERNFDMLKFLLDRKEDVNEPDNNQKTPLSLAIETSNVRLTKLLIERGALVNNVIDKIEARAGSSDSWKMLFEELEAERILLKNVVAEETVNN